MAVVRFDTLRMVERLEFAGVPAAQAKALAAVLADAMGEEESRLTANFSNKQDVSEELVVIKAALEKPDAKIDKTAAEVKSELVRWVGSVGILQMALIAGLVMKLAH